MLAETIHYNSHSHHTTPHTREIYTVLEESVHVISWVTMLQLLYKYMKLCLDYRNKNQENKRELQLCWWKFNSYFSHTHRRDQILGSLLFLQSLLRNNISTVFYLVCLLFDSIINDWWTNTNHIKGKNGAGQICQLSDLIIY